MLDALHRRLDAVGIRTPTSRDALLGAVVAAASAALFLTLLRAVPLDAGEVLGADLTAEDTTTGRLAAACVVLVVQAMALTLRRRAPLACLALTLLGQLALTPLLPALVSFQAPAGVVAAYSVGAYAPRRTALYGASAAAVLQVLLGYVLSGPATSEELGISVGTELWGGLASTLVVYLGAALVGAYVATRRELVAQLHARVDQAEREREALAAQAVLEERGRMARELHDVAAHHLSGIVVQAAAAERLVDADPARAKESLRWIRAQGKDTLDDLRLVVGILRGRDDDATGPEREAPQPTLADVPALVDTARAAGSAVDVETTGEPWEPAPSSQIAVYRVLQEALANARRHAPGRPVAVRFAWSPAEVVLTVRNPGAGTAASPGDPGHGLVGMRERAAMVAGTLDARRAADGAWLVRLVVPRAPGRDGREPVVAAGGVVHATGDAPGIGNEELG